MSEPALPPSVQAFLRRECKLLESQTSNCELLRQFHHDLCEANRSTNLTRITDWLDFCVRHVADSLAVLRVLPELADASASTLTIADVGCGAGFPLFPLLWVQPRLVIVGMESRSRKVQFVETEIARLGFANARCLEGRARELARRDECREQFDIVLLRAVAGTADAVKECRQLVRGCGVIACYKTPEAVRRELPETAREAAKYGFTIECSDTFELPENSGTRQFILCRRVKTN
ncbi:MAG: 16S rRNA (guanine(527)-N(7))-methyltransferase RsmG [Verrucomicrobiota bacterium]